MRVCGLMSGTSADGIDAAIVNIDKNKVQVVAFDMFAYPSAVRKKVLEIGEQKNCTAGDISTLNFLLGELFAQAAIKLCKKNKISLRTIDIVGSHGQTIYHNPKGKVPATLQIGEPSIIAHRTGITTVADFRPMDVAAGGQGAPLVPFADYMLFSHKAKNRVLQNIGGIANLTFLPADSAIGDIIAFDTGPGNMIIDQLVCRTTGGKLTFDKGGKIAASGKVNQKILGQMLKHPYFRKQPPKTTGREMFGEIFCKKFRGQAIANEDMIATATAFTAVSIADAYRKFLPSKPDEIILCGGGAKNKTLVRMLGQYTQSKIFTTNDFGINSDAKEAISFAILAWATIKGIKNNAPNATGAKTAEILGKIILV
ncbi:MAG TPA: anhydro-N-acetylmuramic acid kinase [Phycisphaerales bacterium]|nr:anhydro-N-acetylmuramic acid kinase [Phycisphaerales bacterium]